MQIHEITMRAFLKDHPEHLVGVRRQPAVLIDDDPAGILVMDTDTMIAFTDWTIATGRGDAKKARAFRKLLRQRFGR